MDFNQMKFFNYLINLVLIFAGGNLANEANVCQVPSKSFVS
jgi:hypothetical protein